MQNPFNSQTRVRFANLIKFVVVMAVYKARNATSLLKTAYHSTKQADVALIKTYHPYYQLNGLVYSFTLFGCSFATLEEPEEAGLWFH